MINALIGRKNLESATWNLYRSRCNGSLNGHLTCKSLLLHSKVNENGSNPRIVVNICLQIYDRSWRKFSWKLRKVVFILRFLEKRQSMSAACEIKDYFLLKYLDKMRFWQLFAKYLFARNFSQKNMFSRFVFAKICVK